MEELIFTDFQKGIAPSPHLGFADMRNLDIESVPGVIKINNRTEKKSASTVTDRIVWMISDPNDDGDIYAIDVEGQIYTSTDSGGSWSTLAGNSAGGDGQGIAIWKDYLFVAGTTKIDVYGPLSGSPSWTTNWKTVATDSQYHPMLVAQDDMLYIGAGRYVASLAEVSGQTFAPGTSASFTWNAQALDLPANYKVKCLAELGKNLMIGTWMSANIYDMKVADIFPWDRTSPSFGLPLRLGENGVNAMITINNLLYIIAGIEGKIFVSNGTQVTEVAQIPIHISNIENGAFFRPGPGSICHYKEKLFFGLSCNSAVGGLGVWSFKLGKEENALNFEHVISTGSYGASTGLFVDALLPVSRDVLLIAWKDDSTSGIDKINSGKRYTNYAAYLESKLEPTGRNLTPRTFSECEIQLAKPLAADQGVRVSARKRASGNYTTIATFDHSTYGAVSSYVFEDTPVEDAEFLQIKTELTTGESDTTPEPRAVIFR